MSSPTIEVKNLHYSYPKSEKSAISDISFNVEAEEIFGFLGPSGAGKSTTVKVLTGLLTGYTGSVRLLEKEIKDWKRELYLSIGVAFELPYHYPTLTGMENLQYFGSYYPEIRNLDELFELVELSDAKNEKVGNYSKGMKVRLGFIRSIMHDPVVLFLDEPTVGLDPGYADTIKKIILEQKERGKTIFLTTHNMSLAESICDRIAILDKGKILQLASPKELKMAHSSFNVTIEYIDHSQQINKVTLSLKDLNSNQQFLSILQEASILTIHSQEPSLEELFIALQRGDSP